MILWSGGPDLERVGNLCCVGGDEVPAVKAKGDRDGRHPSCGCDADVNRVCGRL